MEQTLLQAVKNHHTARLNLIDYKNSDKFEDDSPTLDYLVQMVELTKETVDLLQEQMESGEVTRII